uniref:Uncharacterized protein n=1 Tax=Panagrolaimus davidi TaxID=227884 RepID=A0A914PHZ7_9BILA
MNRELPKNTKAEEQTSKKQNSNKNNQISSASEPTISSPPLSSSAGDPPQINFIFHNNVCAVEVVQNGSSKFLTDSFDNKWTPLYFSMAESIAKIGTEAKSHFVTFPKHVIYDVLEVTGKPLNEIRINPKWGFKLIDKDGIVYFYIETFFGPRLLSQEIIFAVFLKTMKFQTESNLNLQINEIYLSTHFELNKSQKNIFVKAAAKNNIEILSFSII